MSTKDQREAGACSEARFFDPTLSHQEILKIADVSNAMLQTWIARGFIKLSAQKPGTGNRRRYDGIEAVRVVMLDPIEERPGSGLHTRKYRSSGLVR